MYRQAKQKIILAKKGFNRVFMIFNVLKTFFSTRNELQQNAKKFNRTTIQLLSSVDLFFKTTYWLL